MKATVAELRERLAQIQDLNGTAGLLMWDQQTMMPARGAEQRADAISTVTRIAHERFTDAETGRLLEAAAAELANADPESDDVVIVRHALRDWEKARRIPDDLAAEIARAASVGQDAWVAARAADDFAAFAPHLQRNIDLARRYVDCLRDFDGYECAYDVLLDDYDPEMRTAEVTRLFDQLKGELAPMIAEVSQHAFETDLTAAEFPVSAQRQLVAEVLRRMGFDPAGWRLDDTVHPFAMAVGAGDMRITTKYAERYFPTGLYSAMHETGHGLYAVGVADELRRTPLGDLRSLSLHESQSRLWENMVGHSRQFCDWVAPRIAELAGGRLSSLDGQTLFRAVNRVKPSLIRIEADEATYGLHIVIRFELEQELVDGSLTVNELPEAWNARMRDYLGVTVPSDADGVLQDIHWPNGLIGYFPTYALGNLISGQLWQRLRDDIPDLDEQLAGAEFGELREWLVQHVHRYGSKFTTGELLRRAVGGPIAVEPFIGYLRDKLGDVYGLQLA